MIGTAQLASDRLRVTFQRVGDRYGHRVESVESGQAALLIESIEGTPAEDWPASPALKELHLEDRPGGKQLALLVGMAGRSHWSLSVELDPHADLLVFDLACRVRDEPEKLTSTYQVQCLPEVQSSDRTKIILPCSLELQTQPIDAITAQLTKSLLTKPSAGIVAVQPHVVSGKLPRTIRWRYSIGPSNGI